MKPALIVAIALLATIAFADEWEKYCPTVTEIYGICSPELVANWLAHANDVYTRPLPWGNASTPNQTIGSSDDSHTLNVTDNGTDSGTTDSIPITTDKPVANQDLATGSSSAFSDPVTLVTPYFFPPDYKTVTKNGLTFDLAKYQSDNIITPTNSTHLIRFRLNTSATAISSAPLTKTFQTVLTGGNAVYTYYQLANFSTTTTCYYLTNKSKNQTCDTNWTTNWDQIGFTNLTLTPRIAGEYLLGVMGNSPFTSGSSNMTIGTTVGPNAVNLALDPTLSACGTIGSSGSYTLTKSISSGTTCLAINTNNVAIDCQGYMVSQTVHSNVAAYGIYAASRTNITVKNCITANYTRGIYLTIPKNSTIDNNTVTNETGYQYICDDVQCANGENVYGISLTTPTNVSITNNLIQNLTGGRGGWFGYESQYNPFSGSNGGSAYGLFISGGSNTTLFNNTVTGINGGTGGRGSDCIDYGRCDVGGDGGYGGSATGVQLGAAAQASSTWVSLLKGGLGGEGGDVAQFNEQGDYGGNGMDGGAATGLSASALAGSNLTNTYIWNVTSGTGGAGGNGDDSNGNSGNGGQAIGLYLTQYSNSSGFTVENITGGNGGQCLDIYGSAWGDGGSSGVADGLGFSQYLNVLSNFTVKNVSVGKFGLGVYSPYGAGANGTTEPASCIDLTGGDVHGTNFTNGILSQCANYTIYSPAPAANNLFLNVSMDKSKITIAFSPTNLTVQWYARVNVTNATSGAGITANIYVNDSASRQEFAGVYALTPWFVVNDTLYSSAGNTNWNPASVFASALGLSNYTTFSFGGPDWTLNLTLGGGGGGPGGKKMVVSVVILDSVDDSKPKAFNWWPYILGSVTLVGVIAIGKNM